MRLRLRHCEAGESCEPKLREKVFFELYLARAEDGIVLLLLALLPIPSECCHPARPHLKDLLCVSLSSPVHRLRSRASHATAHAPFHFVVASAVSYCSPARAIEVKKFLLEYNAEDGSITFDISAATGMLCPVTSRVLQRQLSFSVTI